MTVCMAGGVFTYAKLHLVLESQMQDQRNTVLVPSQNMGIKQATPIVHVCLMIILNNQLDAKQLDSSKKWRHEVEQGYSAHEFNQYLTMMNDSLKWFTTKITALSAMATCSALCKHHVNWFYRASSLSSQSRKTISDIPCLSTCTPSWIQVQLSTVDNHPKTCTIRNKTEDYEFNSTTFVSASTLLCTWIQCK